MQCKMHEMSPFCWVRRRLMSENVMVRNRKFQKASQALIMSFPDMCVVVLKSLYLPDKGRKRSFQKNHVCGCLFLDYGLQAFTSIGDGLGHWSLSPADPDKKSNSQN